MHQVKIYSTPSCKYCKIAKDYFNLKNVPYEEIDLVKQADRREEMMKLTGTVSVPVIVIDGKVIVGYNKEQIDTALA